MAVTRDDPYGPFNFLVTISPESGGEFRGGFSDCSGLNTEITYADYREGTEPFNRPRKIPLMYKAGDVTLKRGLIAALDLWQWVSQVRGSLTPQASRDCPDYLHCFTMDAWPPDAGPLYLRIEHRGFLEMGRLQHLG